MRTHTAKVIQVWLLITAVGALVGCALWISVHPKAATSIAEPTSRPVSSVHGEVAVVKW